MTGREADAGTRGRGGHTWGGAGTRGRGGMRGGAVPPPGPDSPRLFGAGVAGYGCWKPASWRIFCASEVLSQATNAAAASAFLDCFSVAAG